MSEFTLRPIGKVRSPLANRKGAPRQASEGAPEAWIEVEAQYREALDGITAGCEVILLSWLHEARRETLKVHPRNLPENEICGVFWTRSPDRPNPIGLHRVKVLEVDAKQGLRVDALEAIDGTPILDIKPVLSNGNNA